MKDMEAFFMEELEFVEDLQALLDKKLVSQEARVRVRVEGGEVDDRGMCRPTSAPTSPA